MIGRAHIARRGFSLLELSVVLGIIALVAGAGMSMASGALKAADRVATQERLNTIKLALDSHAKTYGYLPCAANPALLPTDGNFGIESRAVPTGTGADCTVTGSIVSVSNIHIGMVPVRTLGLPDSYASDAWGNKLTYAVTIGLAKHAARFSTSEGTTAITGQIGIRYWTGSAAYSIPMQRLSATITSVSTSGGMAQLNLGSSVSISANTPLILSGTTTYKGSYLANATVSSATAVVMAGSTFTVTDTGTLTYQYPGSDAAYAVISHGPDGIGAYPTSSATQKSCSGPTLDVENCNNSNTVFYDTAYNDGAGATDHFDDYVVWGSHASSRPAVNDALYTACPTGVCESWCATCTLNYPGAVTSAPPLSTASPVGPITSNAVLCKKVVTSNASTCSATCFWSGNTATGFVKCP